MERCVSIYESLLLKFTMGVKQAYSIKIFIEIADTIADLLDKIMKINQPFLDILELDIVSLSAQYFSSKFLVELNKFFEKTDTIEKSETFTLYFCLLDLLYCFRRFVPSVQFPLHLLMKKYILDWLLSSENELRNWCENACIKKLIFFFIYFYFYIFFIFILIILFFFFLFYF